jgi:hypothetical protein
MGGAVDPDSSRTRGRLAVPIEKILSAPAAMAALCLLPCALPAGDVPGVDAGVGLELGPAWFSRNDVRIPGDDGTKFDMLDLTGSGADFFVRLDGYWNINEKHGLRLVLAPLEVSGNGNLDRDTEFAGTLFPAGRTKGTYNFSTYRLTYRYTWRDEGTWRWRVGVTGLIRDANVELQQGSLKDNNDDLGFVPLLHLSGDYALAERWRLAFDFDGLAGGPGRAFDISIQVHHDLGDRWRIGGGYRMLEGGVDTDDVYNFSWIHYGVISAQYRF